MSAHVLQVKVLDARFGAQWELPAYATEHSAGLDLRAALEAPLTLHPGDAALVPSGPVSYTHLTLPTKRIV